VADACVVPVLTWDGKVVCVPLHRRALLIAAGALLAGDTPGVEWERVGGAEVPARVGMADVTRIRDGILELGRLEAKVGGAAARYLVLGGLRVARSLKDCAMTPAVRQEWTAATDYLANLAGWVTFDAGLRGPARELFEVALGAAREPGDRGLLARVADNFATLELYVGGTAAAFDLVCLAQSVAGRLPASVRAGVELSAAHAYARLAGTIRARARRPHPPGRGPLRAGRPGRRPGLDSVLHTRHARQRHRCRAVPPRARVGCA